MEDREKRVRTCWLPVWLWVQEETLSQESKMDKGRQTGHPACSCRVPDRDNKNGLRTLLDTSQGQNRLLWRNRRIKDMFKSLVFLGTLGDNERV